LARSRYQVTARTHVRNGRSLGLSKSVHWTCWRTWKANVN